MAEYISKQRAKDLMGCCLVSAKANYKEETDVFKRAKFQCYIETIEAMIDVVGAVETADVKILKREKWKEILEILRDAVKELEYYETHGDILDRHIWKYKNEALALIGEGGEDNE